MSTDLSKEQLIKNNEAQVGSETDSFTLKRYEQFTKFFNGNVKTVVDFGCNTGRGGVVLRNIYPEIKLIGAELLLSRLNQLSKEVYNETIDLSKDDELSSLKDIDIIVMGEVAEHIPFDIFCNYLKQFTSILSKGGKLIMTTPNPDSYLVKLGRDNVLTDPSHINIMSKLFFRTLLEKLGYKVTKVEGSGKMSNYVGTNFPLFNVYGSYLIVAELA